SLIAGSGVDLNRFSYSPSELDYPRRFILVGRLLEEKGVRIYADAARMLKDKYKEKVDFNLLGFIDNENVRAISYSEINSWINDGVVNYLGSTDNVETIVKKMDCVVLPSFYREGIPKSLIEAAALGKIIVTTDNVGCRDTVKDKVSGFLCKPKSVESLVKALEKVILIDKVNAVEMGKESRKLAVEKFDENLIIAEYIKKIES
ncbi:TPA: glycosyltransferase, partial [Escherichia coli]